MASTKRLKFGKIYLMTKTVLPPLRHKPYGGAWSIHDPESVQFLSNIDNVLGNRQKFLADYKEWMAMGKVFKGLDNYQHLDFCAGTTEAFGEFYLQHQKHRLRLYKGEFFYHNIIARNYFSQSAYIGQEPLAKGDVVVMSCPFSNTGTIPNNFYEVLQECDKLEIPVLLDMAYINISCLNNLDLRYKCIHTITTSLSKVFPVENYRIGMRLRRNFYDDNLFAYNQGEYVNLYSINIGHELIKKFRNDWLYDKYKTNQIEMCNQLEVAVSDCVIFGLADRGHFDEYNRDSDINRLCFSRTWDGRIS